MSSTEPTPEAANRPARRRDDGGSSASTAPVSGTSPRPAGLRRPPALMRVGSWLVFVGGLALLAMMVLFASGVRDFPWWAWALVALALVGFAIGALRIRRAGQQVG